MLEAMQTGATTAYLLLTPCPTHLPPGPTSSPWFRMSMPNRSSTPGSARVQVSRPQSARHRICSIAPPGPQSLDWVQPIRPCVPWRPPKLQNRSAFWMISRVREPWESSQLSKLYYHLPEGSVSRLNTGPRESALQVTSLSKLQFPHLWV